MKDLKDYINEMVEGTALSPADIVTFLEDNSWFHCRPEVVDGKVELTDSQISLFTPAIQNFISPDKTLSEMFAEKYPGTAEHFTKFVKRRPKNKRLDEEDVFHITDFLLFALEDELCSYSNIGIVKLLEKAQIEMIKAHGVILTDFISWLLKHVQTEYTKEFVMKERYSMREQREAYSELKFCDFLYYFINEEYIAKNDMYIRATKSRKFVDAWLYITLNLICSVRYTDLQRLGHPELPYPPDVVLKMIAEGTFTDNDARVVLLYIIKRLKYFELTPNKNSKYQFIETIKFEPPSSLEPHLGRLFAIAEAHAQLACDSSPLVRKVSSYIDIKRAMGDEIAALFLERDFGSISATKSYLQGRFNLARSILGSDENNLSARLISHARSHKGSYGEYSRTSLIYLQDAKFNGYTTEYLAFELMERGALSFIPNMILEIVSPEKYKKADVKEQTAIIKGLGLNAGEVEIIVRTVDQIKSRAKEAVNDIVSSGFDLITALKRIGSGVAFSKQPECMCLLSAVDIPCTFPKRRECVGCKYEISTKGTLFLLIGEYNRVAALIKRTDNALEKEKYKHLINNKIVPAMQEILICLQNYDISEVLDYENLVKEYIQNG